jgi:hypothetical protein
MTWRRAPQAARLANILEAACKALFRETCQYEQPKTIRMLSHEW